jgi:hypothetical protein
MRRHLGSLTRSISEPPIRMLMANNILVFPVPHRGDPEPRRMALASIGFQWRAGMWHRGRVLLSDADIDGMNERTWKQRLKRWTKRRPKRRGS